MNFEYIEFIVFLFFLFCCFNVIICFWVRVCVKWTEKRILATLVAARGHHPHHRQLTSCHHYQYSQLILMPVLYPTHRSPYITTTYWTTSSRAYLPLMMMMMIIQTMNKLNTAVKSSHFYHLSIQLPTSSRPRQLPTTTQQQQWERPSTMSIQINLHYQHHHHHHHITVFSSIWSHSYQRSGDFYLATIQVLFQVLWFL